MGKNLESNPQSLSEGPVNVCYFTLQLRRKGARLEEKTHSFRSVTPLKVWDACQGFSRNSEGKAQDHREFKATSATNCSVQTASHRERTKHI